MPFFKGGKMKTHGIYLATSEYYELLKKLDSQYTDDKSRPLYFAVKDKNDPDISYLIPCSTIKTEHKLNRTLDFMKRRGISGAYYDIGSIAGKKAQFRISDVLPMSEKYLEPWNYNGEQYIVQDKKLIKRLETKLFQILAYESRFPNNLQTKITTIRQYLIEELQQEKKRPNNCER